MRRRADRLLLPYQRLSLDAARHSIFAIYLASRLGVKDAAPENAKADAHGHFRLEYFSHLTATPVMAYHARLNTACLFQMPRHGAAQVSRDTFTRLVTRAIYRAPQCPAFLKCRSNEIAWPPRGEYVACAYCRAMVGRPLMSRHYRRLLIDDYFRHGARGLPSHTGRLQQASSVAASHIGVRLKI